MWGKCLLLGGLLAVLAGRPAHAQTKADSLQQQLALLDAPSPQRVKLLVSLSNQLSAGQPPQALAAARQAVREAGQLRYLPGQAAAALELGLRQYELGGLDSAGYWFGQARAAYGRYPAADSVKAQRGTMRVLNAWAAVSANRGQFNEALRLFITNLHIAERLHDTKMQLRSLTNMGSLAQQMLDLPRAVGYYRQVLARADSVHDEREVETTLCNLAGLYSDDKQYALAARYARRALALNQGSGDLENRATMQLVLGQVAQAGGQYAEAERNAQAVLQLGRQTQNPILTSRALGQLGALANLRGQPAQARAYLEQALPPTLQIGFFENVRDTYAGLATAYAALGQYDRAYGFRQKQVAYNDSVVQEKTVSDTRVLQNRFEAERKETQNRLQAARLRAQQQVIERRNAQLLAAGAVVLLLAGAGYLLYARRRLRREVEFARERQQLERLRSQAVLEAEEAERRRIGADLHDGVGQLLVAARLNLSSLGQQLGVQTTSQQVLLDNALELVGDSFREVRQISHNLMPNALIKQGLARAVRDFLQKSSPDERLRVHIEVIGIDENSRLDPLVESVLFRVIQEVVQNIVKHAQATAITLQIIRGPDDLTVVVEDNGVGFDVAALGPEAGIGLRNITTRMTYLGGRADFDSTPGRGTTVILDVPLPAAA